MENGPDQIFIIFHRSGAANIINVKIERTHGILHYNLG